MTREEIAERWFALRYVHMTRPFVPADRDRYRTFFEAFEGFTDPSGTSYAVGTGNVQGGIDKWVRRGRVRAMERAGWHRA